MKNIIIVTFVMLSLTACLVDPPKTQQQVQAEYLPVTNTDPETIKSGSINWPGDMSTVQTSADNLLGRNFLIMLDVSGSMGESACNAREEKMVVAKTAIEMFIKQVPADDNIGLAVFSNDAFLIQPLIPAGTGRDELLKKLANLNPSNGTAIASAIKLGYTELTRQGKDQGGYGEYYLVMVSDGANTYGPEPGSDIQFVLENSPIVLYTIGFCMGQNHVLNQPGKTLYREAERPEELTFALQAVLVESAEYDSASTFNQ